MRFSKWHALGNSYLVVEREEPPLDERRARRLCDAGFGIGADGVLELVCEADGRAAVTVWNPDGSRAELSGNGARIAAAWLGRLTGRETVVLRFGDREVAASLAGGAVTTDLGRVVVGEPETIEVGDAPLELTSVDVGNPHAVVRLDWDDNDVELLGPLIERHPRFPQRTNVQLVRVLAPDEIAIGVWERGAGRTMSSGSSSVAAAAAAAANGWCGNTVTVVHRGAGDLLVELHPDGGRRFRARLTGPVEEVARGETVVSV